MKAGRVLAEFSIIVVGVLVALLLESALEDWREGRLADRYEERLLAEARFNQDDFRIDREWIEDMCVVGAELERELWTDGPEPDSLLLRAFVLALHRTNALRTATYRDLVATGNLALLDDLELRNDILDFYENQVENIRTWRPTAENAYRAAVLPRVPTGWSAGVVECVRSDDANRMRPDWRVCGREPGGGAEAVLEGIRAVPGLRDALATRSYDLCTYPGIQGEAEESLDSLLAELQR